MQTSHPQGQPLNLGLPAPGPNCMPPGSSQKPLRAQYIQRPPHRPCHPQDGRAFEALAVHVSGMVDGRQSEANREQHLQVSYTSASFGGQQG